MPQPLTVFPLSAPVQSGSFDLIATLRNSMRSAAIDLEEGDVVAISSKYAAIAEGRIVELAQVQPTAQARQLAQRYRMDPVIAQLALEEADHVFGGIELGFLLTTKGGVLSPNAGLDRSNIPSGKAVLLAQSAISTSREDSRGFAAVVPLPPWRDPDRQLADAGALWHHGHRHRHGRLPADQG